MVAPSGGGVGGSLSLLLLSAYIIYNILTWYHGGSLWWWSRWVAVTPVTVGITLIFSIQGHRLKTQAHRYFITFLYQLASITVYSFEFTQSYFGPIEICD